MVIPDGKVHASAKNAVKVWKTAFTQNSDPLHVGNTNRGYKLSWCNVWSKRQLQCLMSDATRGEPGKPDNRARASLPGGGRAGRERATRRDRRKVATKQPNDEGLTVLVTNL